MSETLEKIAPTRTRAERRILLYLTISVLVVFMLVVFVSTKNLWVATSPYQTLSSREETTVLPAETILSEEDKSRYIAIAAAQKGQDWETADDIASGLENTILLGYVLAERYLSSSYKSSFDELADWLENYSDHPQAADIYALALSRKPAGAVLTRPHTQSSLTGYGGDNGFNGGKTSAEFDQAWNAGLAAWKTGDATKAAERFAQAKNKAGKDTSTWQQAAAAYWAYRAYKSAGEIASAAEYLHQAAQYPRTFYGIIARRAMGDDLDLDSTPVELDMDIIAEMPGAERAIALVEINDKPMAERELRQLFLHVDRDMQEQLVALAGMLDLPAAQIRMGYALADESRHYDFAIYAAPQMRPQLGFKVDPALVFAVARHESGFHATAKSPDGAMGIMQIMPDTAHYMVRHTDFDTAQLGSSFTRGSSKFLNEPLANLTLGQSYIHHLLVNKLVKGNLFYLLAAYNAGPGNLAQWQRALRYGNDPLLFIETIPYAETRNYIEQVVANYWIYSELMGSDASDTLTAAARNEWPIYRFEASTAAVR